MTVFTKRAADVFAPTDASGNPRGVDVGETQAWGIEVEGGISGAASQEQLDSLSSRVSSTEGAVSDLPSVRADVAAAQATADAALSAAASASKPPKTSVRVMSAADTDTGTALVNGASFNGVTLATGDRVFLAHQDDSKTVTYPDGTTDSPENGVYIVAASGAASRSTDMDSETDIVGARFFVEEGTAGSGTTWVCTTDSPITVGTTGLSFTKSRDDSAVGAKVTILEGGKTKPEEQAGAATYNKISNAIINAGDGGTIELYSHPYTVTATIGTLDGGRTLRGSVSHIAMAANATFLLVKDGCTVEGLYLTGAGRSSGVTGNRGLRLIGGRSMVRGYHAKDMGGAAIQGYNAANRYGNVVSDFSIFDCAIGIEVFGNQANRGEYTIYSNGAISGTGAIPNIGSGVKVAGGNNVFSDLVITNQNIGFEVQTGYNEAHGALIGSLVNHNDINFKYGNVALKEYLVLASHFYGGAFHIGGGGLMAVGNGFGTWSLVENDGADNSVMAWSTWATMPTAYTPNNGGATAVHYFGNILPASVLGNSPWRKTTARSKRTRTSSAQTVSAGNSALIDFNNSVVNALQNNTAFSKHTLWDGTNKVWTMLSFASPASCGRAEGDWIVSVRRADAGVLDKANVQVQLQMGADISASVEEFRPFAKGDVFTASSRETMICTLNGKYEKYAEMGVAVINNSSHHVEVCVHAASTPSQADVWGW